MRTLALLSAAALLLASAAGAQTTPPASPGTGGPTGSSNPAVSTTGNAPSNANPSGTVNIVAPTALEKGANSFTEGQAKDRIVAAGFTSVSSLAKDGDGVWRGNAMKDGKSAKVAVDFKGNVVSQ